MVKSLLNRVETNQRNSVWRPIENEVDEWPLAMLDGSTIPNRNLVNIDHVRRTYVGETQYAVYSSEYRWHYLSRQKKDEVIIMKMYDSAQDVPAKCEWMLNVDVPHFLTTERLPARCFSGSPCGRECETTGDD